MDVVAQLGSRTRLRVALAGAETPVGAAVLARLADDADIAQVLALGPRPGPVPDGVELVRVDLRDRLLARALDGVDVVVSTGVAWDVSLTDVGALQASVHATRRLLEAAGEAGVGAFVLLSSALVYGANEHNPVPLDEQQPLRAVPEFPAAHHALLAEDALRAFAAAHSQLRTVVVRTVPPVVPNIDSTVTRHLESPLLPRVHGFDPPVQFVGLHDLAEAVRLTAIEPRASGAYNVAADGWLTSSDVRHIVARPGLRLPQQTAVIAATVLHRMGVLAVPPEALHYLMHPWVVDTARLRRLGWAPTLSQRALLHQFVTEHRGWVCVGRIRLRTIRAVAAASAGAGLTAGGAAWWMWRRLAARRGYGGPVRRLRMPRSTAARP